MLSPVRSSICHTGGSVKTVEVRIMKFSLYGSPIPLVFRHKFHTEIYGFHQAGCQTREGWRTSHFLALSADISKRVGDTVVAKSLETLSFLGTGLCYK